MICCRKSHSGSKTRTERRGLPVFSCLVDVLAHDQWRVHPQVASSVDALLAGRQPNTQLRSNRDGKLLVRFETSTADVAVKNSTPDAPEISWLSSLGKLAHSMGLTGGSSDSC